MYKALADIIAAEKEKNLPFWKVVMQDDCIELDISEEESFKRMKYMYQVMKESDANYEDTLMSRSGLVGTDGKKVHDARKSGKLVCGDFIGRVIERAIKMGESNACMKRIVAAPTAGLHFTEELLRKAEEKGVKIARVTLHVGIGTFRPVKCEIIEEHKMHFEEYQLTPENAKIINETKQAGGRIISVGTTSSRTLESVAGEDGLVQAGSGSTDIFIYPGYQFKTVDSLITNFHLPKSTLLMLISALYNREAMLAVYETAVKEKYQFFSYGDAMLIL